MKRKVLYLLVAIGLLLPFAQPSQPVSRQKVVVMGFDGLDAGLVEDMMSRGLLPAFQALRERGSYFPLATTNPAQSPVAWSSFITGNNPGKHNVFDFLTRDPETYRPKLTIAEFEKPDSFELGLYRIPLGKPEIKGYRQGTPFWETAKEHGVPTTALLIPVTFPPDTFTRATLAGMGVPDVAGTNGTFSFYTTDRKTRTKAEGGRIIRVNREGNGISMTLRGPRNDFKVGSPFVELPFEAKLEASENIQIQIEGKTIPLEVGEWSDWVHVSFPLFAGEDLKGILRFYLQSMYPEFQLYVSPVNFDPADPAIPLSYPAAYSKELEALIGPFYTQGMPEDTWGLSEERITDKAFLQQVEMIQEERVKIFFSELQRLNEGILTAVFVSSDRVQHMFWRQFDSEHPLYQPIPTQENVIEKVYQHMDWLLARTLKYIDEDTAIIVMSDHGFGSFRRSVHINSWLIREGLMALKVPLPETTGPLFENVDWNRTKAYSMGLNGIWLNVKGREAKGIVEPGDITALKDRISKGLGKLKDGETPVVRRIFDRDKIYSGPFTKDAPDLVVGYDSGYRSSWQTALGAAPETLFDDNLQKWSGDHCVDPELVPGVFFANRKMQGDKPSIMDVAPTILAFYGIENPGMDGKALVLLP